MKMNIFLCKRSLFRETAAKSIFLNYDVISDDAMHLSVNKIFYSSRRLALTMNMQYNE